MRIKKIIPALSILTLGFSPIVFSSCSCKDKKWYEISSDGYSDFIYNRTFSIMCFNNSKYVFGTGWILADATPSDTTDYSYWIATNWHVVAGFKGLSGSKTYHFADTSNKSSISSVISPSRYTGFKSFQYAKENQFRYVSNSVIDFYVAKVDFDNGMNSSTKNKLNKLNEVQRTKGYINEFGTLDDFKSGDKYVGGYPYNSSKAGTSWEVHGIKSSAFQYKENNPHKLGDSYPYSSYWDYSEQLEFNKDSGTFMPGGASGSMLINKDYKICGVYWGGWENDDKEYFPAFSYIGDFIKTSYELE